MIISDIILILRLVLDISLLTALVYAGIRVVRNNSRTIQIVKGILALLLFKMCIDMLQLKTISYLLEIFLRWGMIVILVVLQPEIRSILEQMGTTNSTFVPNLPAERMKKMIDELVKAVSDMSKTKTGALISLQMSQSMEDYAKTGIKMDSDVTAELLETIFQYGTPMHDGAVIIEGDKIACAAAYYPSTAKDLPSKYGARHRAAVGISEVSDSITLIVSEETGNISIAQKGTLTQYTPESLYRYLTSRLIQPDEDRSSVFQPVLDSARNFSNSFTRSRKEEKNDDRIRPLSVLNLLPDSPVGNNPRVKKKPNSSAKQNQKQNGKKDKTSGGEDHGL
ncbi:MAG: diadenylate cyclase CdaA [Allobaculum sp.]